jgi:hypothetical protein
VLAPGSELYFADAHPSFLLMEERDGKLEPTHDFQTPTDRRAIMSAMAEPLPPSSVLR